MAAWRFAASVSGCPARCPLPPWPEDLLWLVGVDCRGLRVPWDGGADSYELVGAEYEDQLEAVVRELLLRLLLRLACAAALCSAISSRVL